MSRYAKYECLTVDVADKVATVTLNRPQARNAINQKLIRELRTIWDDLADDHAVNVVVLTGAGEFFSVGGDVKAMSERPGGDVLEEGEVHDPMISRRAVTRQLELDKPGYRLLVNMGGHGHQEVPHLHVHIFGGRQLFQMIPD